MKKFIREPLAFPIAVIFLFVPGTFNANARLGESAIQCSDRYGPAKTDQVTLMLEKMYPILEGAIQRTFQYQGWKIRAAFLELNGPAVRIDYQKLLTAGTLPQVQDYELAAILKGETGERLAWVQTSYDNPNSPNHGIAKAFEGVLLGGIGAKAWRRTDGAIAQLMPGGMIVLL